MLIIQHKLQNDATPEEKGYSPVVSKINIQASFSR
jgi:hypothetical protein